MNYDELSKAIKILPKVCEKTLKELGRIFKQLPQVIEETENNIRNMDEDKFQKCLSELEDESLRQKAIAIRRGEKVNWFNWF